MLRNAIYKMKLRQCFEDIAHLEPEKMTYRELVCVVQRQVCLCLTS